MLLGYSRFIRMSHYKIYNEKNNNNLGNYEQYRTRNNAGAAL
jgi:hypothetical protein